MVTPEKIPRSILMEQLENPLQGPGAINFDQSAFDDAYIRLEQFFRSDTIRYTCFAPLDGFSSETPEILLGQGLSIQPITEQLRSRYTSDNLSPYGPSISILFAELCLVLNIDAHKVLGT